jgi:hypothetical protein
VAMYPIVAIAVLLLIGVVHASYIPDLLAQRYVGPVGSTLAIIAKPRYALQGTHAYQIVPSTYMLMSAHLIKTYV